MLAQRRYRFGDFTLDIRRGALLRGVDEVRLRPKSFGVLQTLVERPGELVTKDELLEQVWGRAVVVTDGAITQCLIDVRRALGDDAQEIIRTVPRRGYIFTLPVTTSEAEPPEPVANPAAAGPAESVELPDSPRDLATPAVTPDRPDPPVATRKPSGSLPLLGLGLLLAVLAALAWWGTSQRGAAGTATTTAAGQASNAQVQLARKSIAVLPFANLTGQPDGEYVADGIADEVVHLLAQAEGFRVIARTSSFAFKGQSKSIEEIAEQLRVDYVVEGSVRRSGNSLRVNVQLIDAASSSNVWSKAYEREMRDLLAVQQDIAQHVATALQMSLSNGPQADDHVPDPAAYDAFLRARFFFQRRLEGDLAKAEAAFKEALRLDPRMARAWAGLAGTYSVQIREPGADVDALLEQQHQAIDQAVALDPQLAEARIRAAAYYFDAGDLEHANEQLELARELSPDDPMVLWSYATELMAEGRFAEAIDIVRRILASDPASHVARGNLAAMLVTAGRLDEARVELGNFIAMQEQPDPEIAVDLARVDLLQGRNAAALQAAASWPPGPDRDFVTVVAGHALGKADLASAAEARLKAATDATRAFYLAELYTLRGDHDEAFRWLNLAYDRMGPRPWLTDQWLDVDYSPFLVPLRSDARWKPTVQRSVPQAPPSLAGAGTGR